MVQAVASLSALLGQIFVLVGYGCLLFGVLSLLGSLASQGMAFDRVFKAVIFVVAGTMLVNYGKSLL